MQSLKSCVLSKDASDRLDSMYNVKNEAMLLSLETQVKEIKVQDNQTILEHITKLIDLHDPFQPLISTLGIRR